MLNAVVIVCILCFILLFSCINHYVNLRIAALFSCIYVILIHNRVGDLFIVCSVEKQSLQMLCQSQQNLSVVVNIDLHRAVVFLSLKCQMSLFLEKQPKLK